jgi:hypothetical protein
MTFAYWTREIAGWLLILLGLYFFWQSYNNLMRGWIFQATPLTFVGFIVFRGGIHVLKVAVAAQAARSLPGVAQPTARRITRIPTRVVGPTPAQSVIPGPKTRPATSRN